MPTARVTEADLAELVRRGAVIGPPAGAGLAPAAPAAGPAGLSEEEFLQMVRRLAKAGGWTTYHTRDSRKSDAGFPDLVLLRGPRLLWRELKTDTGRLTAAQEGWRDVLLAGGHDWKLWRPADWDAIVAELR